MTDTPKDNNTIVFGGAAQGSNAQARSTETHNALPIGTRMGEFEIIGLVGEGGFGIVYLAQDHSLERKVALKEYMPASLASRGDDSSVVVRSERFQETFEIGRRSFVNEARLLAQFDHPALVKVYRFWEANGTAYMAMPYYDGITLRDTLRTNTTPQSEAWLKSLLDPITEALSIIHKNNCFHRDIAPDNIMLLRDGRPVLLDFGAARRVISDMTQALTVILKPGYAPIEQYAEMPNMKQGAWTDIYALAAVVYYAIARKLPPPSVSRVMQDSYEPIAEIAKGQYSNTFLRGIDLCLAVKPEQRPQTIEEMRELIGIHVRPATPANRPAPAAGADLRMEMPPAQAPAAAQPKKSGAGIWLALGAVVIVLVLAAAGGASWYFLKSRAEQPTALATPAQSVPLAIPQAQVPAQTAAVTPPATPVAAVSQAVENMVPARVEPVKQEVVEARVEPVQTSVTQPTTQPGKKPKPATTANTASGETKPAHTGQNGDKSERDYMRQLNRDLDNMLR